jgi:peptide/nickel transport system substrate-binding protein
MPFNWARTDKFDFKYDPAVAEQLLDQAGLRRGADGVRFRTTLSISPVMSWPDMATVVQEMWKKIGVEVAIESMDFPSLFTKAGERKDFDTVASNVIISHELAELGRFVRSDGDRNWAGYANPRVDELMERAKRITNQSQRKAIYEEVQKILVDEVWRIYLVEFPYHQPIWAEVKDPFWSKEVTGKRANLYQGFLYTYLSR